MEHINSVNFILQNRKSVFPIDYIEKDIPDEIIEQILLNADRAPTHKLTQPWRFKVIKGDKRKALGVFLAETYKKYTPEKLFLEKKYRKNLNKPLQANCVIAINMQRNLADKLPEWEEIAAVAMAVQNMHLTCEAYGIGCYWGSATGLRDYMGEFFDLKEGERSLGFLYMGYFERNNIPLSKRTPINTKVEWL